MIYQLRLSGPYENQSTRTHARASCRVSGVNLTSSQVSRQYKPRQEDGYLTPHPVFMVQEVNQFESAHPGIGLCPL